MGYPVWSVPLILYTDATPNTEFEVPEGFTAVVRDFSLFTYIGAAEAQIQLQASDEAPAFTVAALSVVGAGVYAQWQGRVALPAPGIFSLVNYTADSGTHIYVGGYLLKGTPPS